MELDLMNTYVTSDLHFWHGNIIKYCNRPYEQNSEGISQMNEDIMKEIDALPERSLLINNGDLFMGKPELSQVQALVQRMKQNNKKLWLIMGNHDRQFKRYLKCKDYETSYDICVGLGFDFVSPCPIVINDKLIFSHEPLKVYGDFVNVHGHTHDQGPDWENPDLKDAPKNKYINVCWDNLHKIVTLKDIYKML